MVVSYPPLTTPARVDSRMGLNIDIAFTFAELAGLVPPIQQDGRSMARLLADTEPAWRTDFLYEQWLDPDDEDNDAVPPTNACVRTEEFKWIEYVTGETELYDLLADPFELSNLTNDPLHADVKAELQARLRQLRHDWP
jgi:arylsulfatase A-like enzyme